MRRYQIVVRGEFGDLLTNAFSEHQIETGHGTTVLTAEVDDSEAIYRVLDRLRDFAVDVVSFHEVGVPGA